METFGPRQERIYEEIPAKNHEPAANEIIIYSSTLPRSSPKKAASTIKAKYDTLNKLNSQNADDTDKSSANSDVGRTGDELADSLQQTRIKNADEPTVSPSGKLSDQEMSQIEVFYGSHRTDVYVCGCECLVYACPVDQPVASVDAQPKHIAVPLLMLDTGDSQCRRERRLHLVFAERGTAFMLWRDRVDNLSNYQAFCPDYHAMFFSTDHKKLVGIRFSDADAAETFHRTVGRLTSDISDPALSVNGNTRKKKPRKKSEPLPKKAEISQPVGFQHLTSLDASDLHKYETLRDKVPFVGSDDSSTDDSAIVADCSSSVDDSATYVAGNCRYSVIVASV